MFSLFLISLGALLILTYIYICKSITKLSFMNKIDNKYLRWLLSNIILLSLLFFFNTANYVIVFLHVALFVSITNLVYKYLEKNKKKKTSHDIKFYIGLSLSIIYLSIGAFLAYHVYETHYTIETNKDIATDKFRIVQMSDSHIGTTFNGKGLEKYVLRMNKTNPDIVVITGDFVDDDTSKKDMLDACKSLGKLKSKYGVYYVGGNHDKGYYSYREFTFDKMIEELNKNNVTYLDDKIIDITDNIILIGREDANYPRKTIKDLTKNIDKTKYIIDLNHQPNDYSEESTSGVDLVLSGHTHGGQLIPLGPVGVLIGANDARYGLSKRNDTVFIINSGISDWALDFKTGAISEYGVIDIVSKGK